MLSAGLAVAFIAGACSHPTYSATRIADPPRSVNPSPDYTQSCSPSGPDPSLECLQVVLQAIDGARAKEHVGPMSLPSDFDKLSVAQQLFVALNRERVDRHLPPIAGLSDALGAIAARGASAGRLPPDPGPGYTNADTEWIGAVANSLDAVYHWMYEMAPGPSGGSTSGSAWADRHSILDGFGSGATRSDKGATSLAAILAAAPSAGALSYTWSQATAAIATATLRPRSGLPANASATHIADPPKTVPANPDF